MTLQFSNECSRGSITSNKFDITVTGDFTDITDDRLIHFLAPNPPDYKQSFSGSGLPFSSREQAFMNTPNKITIKLDKDNKFKFNMLMPNTFYDNLGNEVVVPHIIMSYKKNGLITEKIIKLNNGIPFRTLTYSDSRTLSRNPNNYYNSSLPIRSQEQILNDSHFNANKINDRNLFWGFKPPK